MLTCEFDNLTAYGTYLDDTLGDPEAQSYGHRIREAEAPFTYESTAVLAEIDLERSEAKNARGRVLDARLGRPWPGAGTTRSPSHGRPSTCAMPTVPWVADCSS